MSTFLTREEVATLTGAKTRKVQCRVLARERIRYTLNAAGWPVVARSAVDPSVRKADDARPAWTPRVLDDKAA